MKHPAALWIHKKGPCRIEKLQSGRVLFALGGLKEKGRKTGEGVDGKKSYLLLVLPREVQKGLEIFLRIFQVLGNRFDTVDAAVGRWLNWQVAC